MSFARLIASGCGCGYVPCGAGTFASGVAALLGALMFHISFMLLPIAALLATLAGLWAIREARVEGDPHWVVIDEFAGQWLGICGLAQATAPGFIAAFLIFRVLDVTKPGPIGWADQQTGAPGIMADDLIAGAITAGIVWVLGSHWPELFNYNISIQ